MAGLNEILRGRWSQLLTRLLDIAGGAPAPQLTPELQPVIVVQDDSAPNAFLKSEQLMGFGVVSGQLAAKQSYVQLANPNDSGLIIESEGLLIANIEATAQSFGLGLTTISTRAQVNVFARDSRINPGLALGQSGPGRVTFGTDAGADGVAGIAFRQPLLYLLPNTSLYIPVRHVLHPGTALTVWSITVNINTTASFFWRSHTASLGELQL